MRRLAAMARSHDPLRACILLDARCLLHCERSGVEGRRWPLHATYTATARAFFTQSLTQPPAIVISDFHLGPTDRGSDAIDTVSQWFNCAIPAILLTGDTSAVPARLSSEAGVRLLNKPLDAQRLVSLMDE